MPLCPGMLPYLLSSLFLFLSHYVHLPRLSAAASQLLPAATLPKIHYHWDLHAEIKPSDYNTNLKILSAPVQDDIPSLETISHIFGSCLQSILIFFIPIFTVKQASHTPLFTASGIKPFDGVSVIREGAVACLCSVIAENLDRFGPFGRDPFF